MCLGFKDEPHCKAAITMGHGEAHTFSALFSEGTGRNRVQPAQGSQENGMALELGAGGWF